MVTLVRPASLLAIFYLAIFYLSGGCMTLCFYRAGAFVELRLLSVSYFYPRHKI